jgi:hypothetical protein
MGGIYTINYTICDIINPSNCTAEATIVEELPSIAVIVQLCLMITTETVLHQAGENTTYSFKLQIQCTVIRCNHDNLPGLVLTGSPILV